jgi:hypothetical protein
MMTDLSAWMNRKLIRSRIVGGQTARIRDTEIEALFLTEALDAPFDNLRVSADRPFLYCLTAEARANGFMPGDAVEVSGQEPVYYIAEIRDESGMALIELRKA